MSERCNHDEHDIEQLLTGTPPMLKMPEDDAQRVLQTLLQAAEQRPRRTPNLGVISARRFAALAAAAAVVVAALAVLSPGSRSGGIAWADVLHQLTTVRTMTGPLIQTVTAPDGTVTVVKGRMSFKDPGLARIDLEEIVTTEPDGTSKRTTPPDAIIIHRALPEDDVVLRVFPERKVAYRMREDVTGTLLGPSREDELNPAVVAWSKLRDLTADTTRSIGRREIAGQDTVGFAAPLSEVMGPQELHLELDGEVRVWAAADTAIPLAVEVEKRPADGWTVVEVVQPIRWNEPLADALFDDSVTAGYEVYEGRAHRRGFPEPELMPHVTLRIGPESGGPVINELDLVGAVMGRVSFEPWRRPKYRTVITFELTEEAADRLRGFLRDNPKTPLTVDFNGELEIPWVFRRVEWRLIQVEITPLKKRLIDFEREYLVHGEEAAMAEVERQRQRLATPSSAD